MMSDYPRAPPYGTNYPSQHPPNATYPPQYPNHAFAQTDSGYHGAPQYTQNYDASMTAYGYNQHTVPPYGTTPVQSGAPPPAFHGWSQDPTSLQTYSTPQVGMAYPSYSGNSYTSTPQYPVEEQQSYVQNAQYNVGDEGEASGGEYDDTYAPTNPTLIGYGATQYHGSGGSGYISTAQRTAAYMRSQKNSPLQPSQANNDYYSRETTQVGPQYSDSYSQYIAAPKGPDLNDRSETSHNYNGYAPSYVPEQNVKTTSLSQSQAWNKNAPVDSSEPRFNQSHNDVVESEHKHIQPLPPSTKSAAIQDSLATNTATPTPVQSSLSQEVGVKVQKTVAEARKEAEGAVLNLYPFQIGFQTFMDEGFNEQIVGAVFDDLGLTRFSAKSASNTRSSPNLSATRQPSSKTKNLAPSAGYSTTPTLASGQVDMQLRAHGNAVPQDTPVIDKPSVLSSAVTVATPPLAKAPVLTEKERKLQLQMKMEALRKSREQRAQKAAAKSDTVIPNSSVPTPIAEAKPVAKTDISGSEPEPLVSVNTATVPLPKSTVADSDGQAPIGSNSFVSISQPANSHRLPTIPGLFLAPGTDSSAPWSRLSGATNAPVNVSQRKRPVAADFDTPTGTLTPKRPFGQGRYEEPLVINVTDEEQDSDDEDVAMELESSVDHNSPVLAARKMSDHRNTALQTLAVLTNFPGRKPFTPPPVSSASSTPTARKSTLGNPEVLQEKEIAIEALRKKIAEAEAAKALKKARKATNGTNGTGTPRTTDSSGDDTKAMDGDIVKKIEASIHIQRKIDSTEAKVSLDKKRLAEAQAAEVENVAELERSEADQKRLRREQIATELPRVDAEVQRNQLKLELLRSEMARIEAAVRQSLEEKKKMADEMERLGREAEDRLQAEKDKLQRLTSAEASSTSDSLGHTQGPAPERGMKQTTPPVSVQPQSSEPTTSEDSRAITLTDVQQAELPPTVMTNHGPDTKLDIPRLESIPVETPPVISDTGMEIASDYLVPDIVMRDTEHTVTASISQERIEDKNVAESPAPDSVHSAPESVSSPMEVDSRSPSYSPVLERTITTASEREDDYEPPDEMLPTVVRATSGSPPFSPAPPETISGDGLGHDTIGLRPATNEKKAEVALIEPNNPVIRLLTEDAAQLPKRAQVFVPYESPLKLFRAFRFHPHFGREVSGGLRSLTYSHKIDPMIEMCPWEMAGGTCNDETCEYQHVRDVRLPDDDILKFLGSQDAFTGEERVRFIDGLKDALGAIRERKIRDFDTIAQEILAYRRKFLDDDSKVLALEGTTI